MIFAYVKRCNGSNNEVEECSKQLSTISKKWVKLRVNIKTNKGFLTMIMYISFSDLALFAPSAQWRESNGAGHLILSRDQFAAQSLIPETLMASHW